MVPRLNVDHLWKSLGGFELADVCLEVEVGEYFVVLGPSGAGKTVLLQLIAGILKPDRGRVLIDGVDVTRSPPESRCIGYVPQNYALFPHLTVYGNIAFGLRLRKISKREVEERVRRVAEKLGIAHLLHRKPGTLSGGEAQRAALARALVIEPKVLLLDEPLSAVDPALRWELRDYLRKIHREFEATVVHVTHDFTEALALADRVAVLNDGRVEQVGHPGEVFYKPRTEFVAWFTRVENVYRGVARPIGGGLSVVEVGQQLFVVRGECRGEVVVSFRPEYVTVSKSRVESSVRNEIEGVVEDFIDEGPLVLLKIRVGDLDVKAYVTKSSFADLGVGRGSRVYLYVKASRIHVIDVSRKAQGSRSR